ncbi:hypothetical protein [Herbiconiux sp. YIM B11900]|uniref:hypothetical protein n=1 Tax=Herbiconiux sp. YIM B11900 TaxID=3404131 RepID=UPI003F83B6D5
MLARKTAASTRGRSVVKACGAAALVGAALLVLAGCSANPTAALSKLAHLDSGTLLASGELPPTIEGVDADIVPSSYRLLTEHDGTEFWVGVTGDNDVCFVAEAADTQARCVSAQQFGLHGATLRLESDDELYWLHTEYMTVDPVWTPISPNVAVRD